MAISRSIRSCSRARTSSERGFALALALIVAVLYFGLMQLMLMDASRELAEARRFRARVIALALAENGAELAAMHLATDTPTKPLHQYTDDQGEMRGTVVKNGTPSDDNTIGFTITGTGDVSGIVETHATVSVQGRIRGSAIYIDYTNHSQ